MATETFFWAVELTKGNPESTWPTDVPDDECEEDATYLLEVERGCLGISAKQNDLNVVSVSTLVNDGESSTLTPIARLKVGGKEQCRIGLQFNSRVTFKLTSGNGPVHLMGLRETSYEDEDDIDTMEDDEFDDEGDSDGLADIDPMPVFVSKKRPSTSGTVPPGKKQSRGMSAPGDDDEDDSEEYDSEEEDSEDELNLVAGKKANGLAGKLVLADDDDDDDEDDDDFDVDDEDDDDEDDEDDEDEDDEDDSDEDSDEDMDVPQLVPATKGKPQKGAQQQQQKGGKPGQGKGQQKGGKPGQGKDQQKGGKEQQKGGKEQQKGGKPAQGKEQQTPQKGKQDASADPPNAEAVLKKLNASPNVPKKPEKFANLMKNTYKLTDQAVINDLWSKVQKNRK